MRTNGTRHRDFLGFFIVHEDRQMGSLHLDDTEQFSTEEQARDWINSNGEPGIEYFICGSVFSFSHTRSV